MWLQELLVKLLCLLSVLKHLSSSTSHQVYFLTACRLCLACRSYKFVVKLKQVGILAATRVLQWDTSSEYCSYFESYQNTAMIMLASQGYEYEFGVDLVPDRGTCNIKIRKQFPKLSDGKEVKLFKNDEELYQPSMQERTESNWMEGCSSRLSCIFTRNGTIKSIVGESAQWVFLKHLFSIASRVSLSQ